MLRPKVAVAMSGGVDSAVAALLLQKSGYAVHGIFMRTWHAEDSAKPLSNCPWQKDLIDARSVCEKIGITFEVVNMIAHYRELVVAELVEGYKNGETPNPDILCNARIKFGILRQYAHDNGFENFATGHYCKTEKHADGSVDLCEAKDKNKDQSYFLAMLSQNQVRNVIFPVGNLEKSEVRSIAKVAGLPNCQKKDSQGICFLGKLKIQNFLSHYIENKPGEIVDLDRNILGHHNGLFRFTIGQRHGMNLPSNRDFAHYVVVAKDLERNQLIVEIEDTSSKSLYKKEFSIHGLSFINRPVDICEQLLARPRYRDPVQEIELCRTGDASALVTFKFPQRALSAGQTIALYRGETLIGGGIFGKYSA